MDYHNASQGIQKAVTTESDENDWMPDFDDNILIETALNWMASESPLPALREDMMERDPLWDRNVRLMRRLIQFNVDKLDGA